MDLPQKLIALGLDLPPAPKPVASYVPCVEANGLIFVSGQLPTREGELLTTGRMPHVTLEDAQGAAAQAARNGLAIGNDVIGGDLSRFGRMVKLDVFVASEPDFTEQHKVANGASELIGQLFGDTGEHARAAVGVSSLPLNATVELAMTLAVN